MPAREKRPRLPGFIQIPPWRASPKHSDLFMCTHTRFNKAAVSEAGGGPSLSYDAAAEACSDGRHHRDAQRTAASGRPDKDLQRQLYGSCSPRKRDMYSGDAHSSHGSEG